MKGCTKLFLLIYKFVTRTFVRAKKLFAVGSCICVKNAAENREATLRSLLNGPHLRSRSPRPEGVLRQRACLLHR